MLFLGFAHLPLSLFLRCSLALLSLDLPGLQFFLMTRVASHDGSLVAFSLSARVI